MASSPERYTEDQTLEDALALHRSYEDRAEAAGATVFRLTTDVAHWHESGITTGRQFWDYIEGCARG